VTSNALNPGEIKSL